MAPAQTRGSKAAAVAAEIEHQSKTNYHKSNNGKKPKYVAPEIVFGSFPVELRIHPDKGRYFVATRDIAPNEVVMRSAPYVISVSEECKRFVCSYCYDHYQVPLNYFCETCCEVYYCDENCQKKAFDGKYHNDIECQALRKLAASKKFKDERSEIRIILNALSLRGTIGSDAQCLGNKKNCHYPSFNELCMLHGFKAVYPPDMQEYLQSIADFTATLLPPAALKGLPKSIIVDLICKERLNSFGHWSNQGKALGTAMYPASSFFNHACLPNCEASYETRESIIKCVLPVSKGDELCISYIWLNQASTAERRKKLQESYLFTCICPRCMDTSGVMDAKVALIVCRQEGCSGIMMPISPEKEKCSQCNSTRVAGRFQQSLNKKKKSDKKEGEKNDKDSKEAGEKKKKRKKKGHHGGHNDTGSFGLLSLVDDIISIPKLALITDEKERRSRLERLQFALVVALLLALLFALFVWYRLYGRQIFQLAEKAPKL